MLLGRPATAQEWVTFENETGTRLVADPVVGSSDTEEKDYAWADIDQDGDIDLVVVRKQEWTTRGRRRNVLFMNEGGVLVDRTADFASASTVTLEETGLTSQGMLDETNDRDVIFVDVTGDGWLDMVTSTTLSANGNNKSISHPRIYINLGNDGVGNWQGFIFDDKNRVPTMHVEPRFCSVAAGDIDGDGDQDLYFGDYQQGPLPDRPSDLNDRLWINDGSGYFTDESELRMTDEMLNSAFGMAAAIADMNGDGALDVIKDTALVFPQRVSISYNDPDNEGFFNVFHVPHEQAPYHMSVGDLNNDGRLDMVITDDGADRYDLNDGNGNDEIADFTYRVFSFSGGGSDDGFGGNNLIVDLDNDGWNDVIITDVDVDISGCNRRTHIYRNLANPPNVTLQEQQSGGAVVGIPTSMLSGTHDIAVFDINGDGWKDMVIGRCSSTQVWINQPPFGVNFTYPQGLPELAAPEEDVELQVALEIVGDAIVQSVTLSASVDDGPFVTTKMQDLGGDVHAGILQGQPCGLRTEFYITVELIDGGGTFTDPPSAPGAGVYEVAWALGTQITLLDEIEDDVSGWEIASSGSLTGGEWEQADPNLTFDSCGVISPADDDTPGDGVMAFVTGAGSPGDDPEDQDVDGGPTSLTSPLIDVAGLEATISYSQWFVSCLGSLDTMTVEVSNNGGDSWTLVNEVEETGHEWVTASFIVSDFVEPTDSVRVRFFTSDPENDSLTEAGIDNFQVEILVCGEEQPCEGDANGDGTVDPLDSGYVLARFGCPVGTGDPSCDAADQNGDGAVDPLDSGFVLARFGDCE
ncbi:MAG: VCBS repeat-containing protein [Planctomycetes bacterium]|nr:VCBS repeat-containing protein [Planctomycetota bacterium]